MKKIISIFLILSFFTQSVFAQEISPMKEGQRAPFDGILFSLGADKERELKLVDLELKLKEFELEKKKEITQIKIDFETKTKILQMEIEQNQKREKERIQLKNERIKELTEDLVKADKNYSVWWFAGGFTAGVLVVILSAVALDKATKNN